MDIRLFHFLNKFLPFPSRQTNSFLFFLNHSEEFNFCKKHKKLLCEVGAMNVGWDIYL